MTIQLKIVKFKHDKYYFYKKLDDLNIVLNK